MCGICSFIWMKGFVMRILLSSQRHCSRSESVGRRQAFWRDLKLGGGGGRNFKWPWTNIGSINYISRQESNSQMKARVHKMCQSCQTWPAKFGQILLRTDTRLVFCNRKLMRTDIFFTRTTKPICNFANSAPVINM